MDFIGKIPEHWRYAMIVVLIVLVIALLAKWMGGSRRYSAEFLRQIKHLLNDASRMQAMSEQDSNPSVALMHANYALAYANAVRLLLPDDEIRRISGIHMGEFVVVLTQNQQEKFQMLGQHCAAGVPASNDNENYAISTGWMP
jgi:hypothetical protein